MLNIGPFVDCSDFLGNRDQLLSHVAENGYLFFRGLLPSDAVLQLRREVLQVAARHELLGDVTDTEDAICREGVFVSENDATPAYRRFYNDILRLRTFHAFPHYTRVVSALEILLAEPVFAHPRHICHVIFPGSNSATTPPHQDFHPVRGTRDTWTVWTPLGDCDADLGGLAIARGSHRRGFLDDESVRSGQLFSADTEWSWNPFSCGDVLMFHSLTIHRGRDNMTADRIRLATSARYQPASQPVDADALEPHMHWAEWDELYADWDQDDSLKYYWRSVDLDVLPAFHQAAAQARKERANQ